MAQSTLLAAALARLATAINAVNTLLSAVSSSVGDKAALTTANKTSMTAAINECKAALDAIPAGAAINDTATGVGSTWSSSKINAQITAAVTGLINGALGDSDTMKELADKIAALAQADTGLVSASAAQAFSPAQKAQACANIGIGDPEHDFVPAIEAALNPGL